ncbi:MULTISPECIES: triose-phosphate isomerase [Rhizobium]|uniref:Triosephosphate isomerase n=1 Tax=Rhizobium tropici TaxID=398 RepID=A0A6P1C7Y3_RHITR|nr:MULTISPECIES: triose-phosphate isomerase [Rhizobium]MBB4242984.1 triosephosphate isomerase [Rhizobium tropici]MBB5594601.1 triosephosphate isomerase [Rhizobium tropici]MBB6493310.1 triosephosphate isomerase [Rhizobium tropici]NEV11515.1 triose-phosphate isomerase [Rhizobium tropici]TGE95790.1 triose-phosphate isomerase [Rhizobium sp. SEMIA 4088]
MRKLIAGNWKMNGFVSSQAEIEALKGLTGSAACDIVVCPPFTLIDRAVERARESHLVIGAQDCHAQACGAHTGDVSAEMLADAGVRYIILGHSERRMSYGEDNDIVLAKAIAAHRAGLIAIICVGETRHERDEGRAIEVVGDQLSGSIPQGANSANLVIAYEPVWAIGTGLVPTSEQIEEVHSAIRRLLEERMGRDGSLVKILYGGSVKASNAPAIFGLSNVNGALVGGASLKASEFAGIISAAG